jgi:hypothetical protein
VKGAGTGAVPASGEQEMPRGLPVFQNLDTYGTVTAAWCRIQSLQRVRPWIHTQADRQIGFEMSAASFPLRQSRYLDPQGFRPETLRPPLSVEFALVGSYIMFIGILFLKLKNLFVTGSGELEKIDGSPKG